jgi:hypothetical protein
MRRERAAVMAIDADAHWLAPIWGRADKSADIFFSYRFLL